ncbi:tail fiber domain-containing protein [Altibacter sp. HG106]|uniref:tail fiber domain-containing protein n=1 Tax=Altibacter sp. HG106 TaxID=3023937 RepID=UPI002350BD13|nr:tail fiber domain-containing protein [Altibacter sp. HG106]MDC7994723.1 tail fiber domain-containing protein [Altibacter sp. HG106]
MKAIYTLAFLFLYSTSFLIAQVGIGNTNPNAQLDISATDVSNPANTDGLLIPRIDEFPATNPTAAQDGMLVFITGNGAPSEGFYYWDNGTSSWIVLSGTTSDADWFEEGTTNPATSITDNIVTQGNVSIGTNLNGVSNTKLNIANDIAVNTNALRIAPEGTNTPGGTVYGIYNQDLGITPSGHLNYRGIYNRMSTTHIGSTYGLHNEFFNNGGAEYGVLNEFNSTQGAVGFRNEFTGTNGTSSTFTGLENRFLSADTHEGVIYGVLNTLFSEGNGIRYGTKTNIRGSGVGNKYGSHVLIDPTANGTHYGYYAEVENSTGYAGYFIGRASFGTDPSTGRYLLPATDGTAGQVMTTDGAGNITFATLSPSGGTLDEAYDFGGAGLGRTITADNGAVAIEGDGGLRVESTSETNMLRVDGTSDAVGIGEASPVSPLHVGKTTNFDLSYANTGQDGLYVDGGSGGGLNSWGGSIGFGPNAVVRKGQRKAAIAAIQTAGDEDLLGLAFYVHGNAINQSPMVEGMRLNHARQLGINNNDPDATLDVVGTLQFVDGNEAAGYVLASDANGNASWTDPATITPEDADWYVSSTTSSPTSIAQNIYTEGNVAIDDGTLSIVTDNTNAVDVDLTGTATRVGMNMTLTGSTPTTGISSFINNRDEMNISQNFTGIYQNFAGSMTSGRTLKGMRNWFQAGSNYQGTIVGIENDIDSNNNGVQYAVFNMLSGTGTGDKYGSYNTITNTAGGTHYGVYSNVLKTGSYAGYFLGNVAIGTVSGNTYTLPSTRGSNGQIMQTDGSGNVSWVTSPTTESTTASNGVTETGNDIQLGGALTQDTTIDQGNFDIEYDLTGTANFAIYDNGADAFFVRNTGNVGIGTSAPVLRLDVREDRNTSATASQIQKTDNTSAITTALSVSKQSNGTGTSRGIDMLLSGSGTGTRYGTNITFSSTGNAAEYAFYSAFAGNTNGSKRGLNNYFNNGGTGSNYGVFSRFSTNVSAAQFGVYNDFTGSSGSYYGVQNDMGGATVNPATGLDNILDGTGTGTKTGVSNFFDGSNGNSNAYFGLDNNFNDTGNGIRYGSRSLMNGNGNGNHYGMYNALTGTGSGAKYGTFNIINVGAGGTHFGTYNNVNTANGWAGYFVGKNYISDRLSIGETDNSDAAISILKNSGANYSHLELRQLSANGGSRIRFKNNAETDHEWVVFSRADDTDSDSRFNVFYTTVGNVIVATGDGNVGIGRTPTTNTFEVEGTASKATAGTWAGNSDRRLKKKIETIASSEALEKLLQLRGVSYEWNDQKTGIERPEGIQYGFIAQELMEVFPEKVSEDAQGYYQTAYGDYDPLFVQAIKELNQKISDLETQNENLKKQLKSYETLEARLSALEAQNKDSKEPALPTAEK